MADTVSTEACVGDKHYKLLNLKREISSNEWDLLPTCETDFHGDKEEYQCNVHFAFTELRNMKILVLDPILNINFLLSCTPSSDHISMQTCFPWNLGDEKEDTDWTFDHCLIKMEFKDQDPTAKTVLATKCFHVEAGSGKCKLADKTHLTQCSEVANFHDSQFISKQELVTSFDFCHLSTKRPKFSFVPPMVVEIQIRMYKKENRELVGQSSQVDEAPLLGLQHNCGNGYSCLYSPGSPLPSTLSSWTPKLLPTSSGTDVTFLVGPNLKAYKAHQCVLAAQSSTFKTIFEDLNGTAEVKWGDVPCPVFELLLNFCYGIDIMHQFGSVELLLEALKLTSRFKVEDLTQLCIESLIGSSNSSFTENTAFDLYRTGRMLGNKGLIFRGLQWMQRNGNAA